MNELAPLTIWAVTILHVFFAKFGLVKDWNITLIHYLVLSVSERALVPVLAVAGLLEIFAHLGPELVDIWG